MGRRSVAGDKAVREEAGPTFTISKETTYITAPLRKDGFPDYIAALNQRFSKGVTPERNSAVLFWKAVGPKAIPEKTREKYFQMLGIPPLPEKGDYFVASSDFVERQRADKKLTPDELKTFEAGTYWDSFNTAMQRPWSKKEFPVWAEWLAVNEKPLALAAEACRRPRYYDPMLTSAGDSGLLLAALLPGVLNSREFARALKVRAMLRVQEEKIDEAWADMLTCHRLGRHVGQGPTLVEALVGITIDGMAQAGDLAILQHAKLTAVQLVKMRAELAQLPPMSKMADKFDVTERMMFLDSTLVVARGDTRSLTFLAGFGGDEKSLVAMIQKAVATSLDWDIILRMGNTWYDRLTVAAQKPTRAKRVKAFAKFDAELKNLTASSRDPKTFTLTILGGKKAISEQTGHVLMSLSLPGISAALNAEDRIAMQWAINDLAFALAQYHADHGSYPAKLADLTPKYVAELPKDVFSNDADLHYQVNTDGYLLYSVGINGKDDGGKTYNDPNSIGCDDLVVRMPAAAK